MFSGTLCIYQEYQKQNSPKLFHSSPGETKFNTFNLELTSFQFSSASIDKVRRNTKKEKKTQRFNFGEEDEIDGITRVANNNKKQTKLKNTQQITIYVSMNK